MALVSLQDVCLAFGGAPLLDHATMQIERGERICLLGRNGCGKTTLLRLIHGDLLPDQGAVARSPGLTSARLDQEIPSDIAGTVLEVVTSGLGARGQLLADYRRTGAMLAESGGTDPQWLARLDRLSQALDVDRGWEIHRRVEDIVARLGLPADHAFASLSTGQRRRTLLARALVAEPDVLLLDEPTNHLDIDSIAWLEDFLTTTRSTVILVTHDRALVRKVADRIIELDRGRLIDGRCGYDTFLERKEQEMAAERERDGRLDRRLAIEEAWLRRGVKARRTRDEGRVKALLRMRQQRLARREQAGRLNLTIQSGGRTGTLVMEAERIAFSFGERPVVTDFSCQVLRGDRVGIVGANGCGKTTLLRLLLGELQPQRGQVRLGTNLEVIYFDQLRQQLDEEKSVFDNVVDGNDTVLVGSRRQHVIGYLQKFLFPPERAQVKVRVLSGGERCRLLLAKLLIHPANVLVLDEPTNDLDLETLEFLEEQLADFPGTLLLVSHDRTFLNNLVTSVLAFEAPGTVSETIGGVDDWLRQRQREKEVRETRPAAPPLVRRRAPRHRLGFNEERELAGLPERIEGLENEKAQVMASLADPDFYRTAGSDIGRVNAWLMELEEALTRLYERWQELEEIKSGGAAGAG